MKTTFTKGGFIHQQLKRSGQVALFERHKDNRAQLHYEVVRIREHKAYAIAGVQMPAGEHYPSSESWGADGFTYNDKADAEARFSEMTAALNAK